MNTKANINKHLLSLLDKTIAIAYENTNEDSLKLVHAAVDAITLFSVNYYDPHENY